LLLLGPVRIKYIAAFFVVLSFIGTVEANAGGNLAHLGGALIGYLYIKQLQAGRNIGAWVTVLLDSFRRIFKPEARVTVAYRGQRTKTKEGRKPATDRLSQDESDANLDKISEGGYEGVTREENEKLFNASRN